jgi:hypothetical protein
VHGTKFGPAPSARIAASPERQRLRHFAATSARAPLRRCAASRLILSTSKRSCELSLNTTSSQRAAIPSRVQRE